MTEKNYQVLSIVIKNVPFKSMGAYGDTLPLNVMAQCEKIAVREIIKNNFDITSKEVHLFRNSLNMSLKEFGSQFGVTDVAILKWEKNTKIPLGQKALIKAFMRQVLEFPPIKYNQLKQFYEAQRIEVEYSEELIFQDVVEQAC